MPRTCIRIIILFFVMIFSSSAFTSPASAKEKIKIGYFKNEPQTIIENGKRSGGIIEYWEKYLAPEMGVDIEWVGPLPPVRLLSMLEQGEINCIALLGKNDERAKKYDYPKEPFTMMNAGLAILKTKKLTKITSINTIADYTIGFWDNGFIHPVLKNSTIKWDLLTSVDWKTQNFNKVMAGRIDAFYDPDITTLFYSLKTTPVYAEKLVVLSIPNTQSGLYSIFSKVDKGKFLAMYNIAHKKVLNKVNYQKILNKYI